MITGWHKTGILTVESMSRRIISMNFCPLLSPSRFGNNFYVDNNPPFDCVQLEFQQTFLFIQFTGKDKSHHSDIVVQSRGAGQQKGGIEKK